MTMSKKSSGPLLIGTVLIVLASAIGADEPTKTVDAGGLVFTVPAAWKSIPVTNAMQRAKLKVEPVKGDDDGAEVIITSLSGTGGGVDANIARWEKTFKTKDGAQAKSETKKVKGKNVEVTRVDISGVYTPANFGGPKQPEKPDARLLGAIVLTDESSYFVRLIGSSKTVTAAKDDFDKLTASMQSQDK